MNASAEAGHKLFLENEWLKKEQRRNWEQYKLVIKERNEFEAKLKAVRENREGTGCPGCPHKECARAISERDEARRERDRALSRSKELLEEIVPLRALQRAIVAVVPKNEGLDEAIDLDEDDDE